MRQVRKHERRRAVAVGAACALVLAASQTVALASTWEEGDVFAGFGDITYNVYDNDGTFKENVATGLSGGFGTGCAFDSNEDFYATGFTSGRIVVLDDGHPHGVVDTIDPSADGKSAPESVVFDEDEDFLVGGPFEGAIARYNADGTFDQLYTVASAGTGTDWVDLASDQATLFYTGEGSVVKRFDTSGAGTQLPDFATGLSSAFALRLLPPGDGSGGLLVANGVDIKRLDGSGAVADTIDAPSEDFWFALNLDPNGESFWSAGLFTGNLYRFNIDSGAVEVGPIATGKTVGGLCVKGELTAGGGGGTPSPGAECKGRDATITGDGTGEVIEGTNKRDVIDARAGGDRVNGKDGDDIICAGAGRDEADGGKGNDRVYGDGGNDEVKGDKGDDEVHGGLGRRDRVLGGPGDDELWGGPEPGRDHCIGGGGRDVFSEGCQKRSP